MTLKRRKNRGTTLMKIMNQSADELVLKEGSASGVTVGVVLIIGGAFAWYFMHSSNSIVIWIALAMAALGIGLILFSSAITVTANKTSGQLLYQKKRLIGAKDSTYAIADIFRIETRKQWQVQNTTAPGNSNVPIQQPVLVAQSVIVFKDGRELALDHQKNSSTTAIGSAVLMGGQGAETALAMKVANFIGVPFEEIAPPGMGAGINIIGGGGRLQL